MPSNRVKHEQERLIKGPLGYFTSKDHREYIGPKPKSLLTWEGNQPSSERTGNEQVSPEAYLNYDLVEYHNQIIEAFDVVRVLATDPASMWSAIDWYDRRRGEFINRTQLWWQGELICEAITVSTHPYQSLVEAATSRKPQVLMAGLFGDSKPSKVVYTEEARSSLSRIWDILTKEFQVKVPALRK